MRTQEISFEMTLGDLGEVSHSVESLDWLQDCLKDRSKLEQEVMAHFGKADDKAQLEYIRQTILPELDVVIPVLFDVMCSEGPVRVGLPIKKAE